MDLTNKNKKAEMGCLLIHGFGGNVEEVRPLADFLVQKGCKVEMPSLKGHTGKREDLKTVNYRDWLSSVQEGYDKIRAACETVFLIGFSMGGLLAFQMAVKNRADAVVTLNTPIYYWDLKRVAANILEDLKARKFNHIRRYVDSSRSLPLKAMLNFQWLLSKTKRILNKITCPVMIAQALEDDAVRKTSANYICRHVGSACKRLAFYENSGHLILWSLAAPGVLEDVWGFLRQTHS